MLLVSALPLLDLGTHASLCRPVGFERKLAAAMADSREQISSRARQPLCLQIMRLKVGQASATNDCRCSPRSQSANCRASRGQPGQVWSPSPGWHPAMERASHATRSTGGWAVAAAAAAGQRRLGSGSSSDGWAAAVL